MGERRFFFLIFFSLNSIEKHKKEEDKLRREKAFLRIKKKKFKSFEGFDAQKRESGSKIEEENI
jgi:hypothetical protein